MKSTAAREAENRLGDGPACLHYRIEGRFEIVDPYDRQWRRKRIGRIAL
jgi:hypothetical protein